MTLGFDIKSLRDNLERKRGYACRFSGSCKGALRNSFSCGSRHDRRWGERGELPVKPFLEPGIGARVDFVRFAENPVQIIHGNRQSHLATRTIGKAEGAAVAMVWAAEGGEHIV